MSKKGRLLFRIIENHPNDSRVKFREDDTFQTLSGRMGTGGGNVPMVLQESMITDNKDSDMVCLNDQGGNCMSVTENMTNGLRAQEHGHQPCVAENTVVRRLTPLECERLQGYPDGWTDIGEWIDTKGKKHKDADSPRYKALGNSIALPFWQWMAERMAKTLKDDGIEDPTMASLFDGISGFCLVYKRCGAEPIWTSEIEEFPIAVCKKHFGNEETGEKGDIDGYI